MKYEQHTLNVDFPDEERDPTPWGMDEDAPWRGNPVLLSLAFLTGLSIRFIVAWALITFVIGWTMSPFQIFGLILLFDLLK